MNDFKSIKRVPVRAILLTKNCYDQLEDWIAYHSILLGGHSSIVIIDHGTTDPYVLKIYERVKALGVSIYVETRPFNQAYIFMTEYLRQWAPYSDWLWPVEDDEYLFGLKDGRNVDVLKEGKDKWQVTAIRDVLSGETNKWMLSEDIETYLKSLPDHVSILRYGSFWGTIVDPPLQSFERPAYEITEFIDQNWDKILVRASSFDRITQWCHHASCTQGSKIVTQRLGVLHFHDTGLPRRFQKAIAVLRHFNYIPWHASVEEQIAHIQPYIQSEVDHWHKLVYYVEGLRVGLKPDNV